ncbi:hypothetical protein IVA78_14090 [Bradyrhizobium sp. 137]|nr:hypothetical protein [Bradyrhizobium sp. 137]
MGSRALTEHATKQIGRVAGGFRQHAGAVALDRPPAQMRAPAVFVGEARSEMFEPSPSRLVGGSQPASQRWRFAPGLRELVNGSIDPIDHVAGAERLSDEIGRAAG